MDTFLHYFTDTAHIKAIIYALFGLILILSMVLTFIKIKYDEPGTSSKGSLKDIEDTLKKVLDQTKGGVALGTGDAAEAGEPGNLSELGDVAAGAGMSTEELDALKKDIEEKQQEIEDLKNAAQSSDGGIGSDEHEAVMKKVEELEGKLQEYEIIEDDIADLSLFKDENAKLKEELEALKAGRASPAPAEPVAEAPAEAAPEPEAEEKSEDLVAEFAAAVESPEPPAPDADKKVEEAPVIPTEAVASALEPEAQEAAAPEASPEPEAQPEAEEKVAAPTKDDVLSEVASSTAPKEEAATATEEEPFGTDDVLAEFAAAVNESLSSEDVVPPSVPDEPKEESVSEPAKKAPVEASAEAPAEEVKAEASEDATTEEGDDALAGDIDTSKMLSEMEDLSNIEVNESENALEGETDIEKMAAEAMSLENNDST